MMYILKFHTAYNEHSKSGDLARVVKKDYKNFSTASAAATRIANINRRTLSVVSAKSLFTGLYVLLTSA